MGKNARFLSTRDKSIPTCVIGKIGENKVESHLLASGYEVFTASADTCGIDLVCFKPRMWKGQPIINMITIQVKYHTVSNSTNYGKALRVNICANNSQWVAVPIDRGFIDDDEHILYYPNKVTGKRYGKEFAFRKKWSRKPGLTNQHTTTWAEDYYKLPKPRKIVVPN